MALKIVIEPLAEIDINEAVYWYESKKKGLGESFLMNFRDAMESISEFPETFRIRHKAIRAFSLDKFPYNVHYKIEKNAVHVFAVIHQKRNPLLWKQRT